MLAIDQLLSAADAACHSVEHGWDGSQLLDAPVSGPANYSSLIWPSCTHADSKHMC